jgi:hypothetical protein
VSLPAACCGEAHRGIACRECLRQQDPGYRLAIQARFMLQVARTPL